MTQEVTKPYVLDPWMYEAVHKRPTNVWNLLLFDLGVYKTLRVVPMGV